MAQFAVSAIGRDRPGIVAEVTRVLLEEDVNIEDSQMTILRGRFTMMLIVSAPAELDADRMNSELEPVGRQLGLDAISVAEVAPRGEVREPHPSHIVTVYGVDHPGIVHAVTAALAGANVNITDVNTRLVSDGAGADLYAMMLEVALPPGLSADALETLLDATRRDQGVEITVRELEQDEL